MPNRMPVPLGKTRSRRLQLFFVAAGVAFAFLWGTHQQWYLGLAAFVFIVPPFFRYTLFQQEARSYRPRAAVRPSSQEATLLLDVGTGKYVDANSKALDLFKSSLSSIRKKGPEDLSPPYQPSGASSQSLAKYRISQALNNGKSSHFEWVHQNSHGEIIPCEVRLEKVASAEGVLLR